MPTRVISFTGTALAIEYKGVRPERIVNFLYRHVLAGAKVPPHIIYHLLPGEGPDELILHRSDTLVYKGQNEATVAELLLGDTCHDLADRSRGGLLFHAAALTWRSRGLLLAGPTGAGKSTLAAWLLTQGFDYLTDELVFVPYGADTMQALTRPLNLKHPSRHVLQYLFDFAEQKQNIFSTPNADLIPSTLLNPACPLNEAALNLIILPRFQPESDSELRPLSKARAGLALMQCLVNARNLPEHGFPEITRLVRQVPAFQMTHSNLAQIGEQIIALLQLGIGEVD
jgi:hypothetical protein